MKRCIWCLQVNADSAEEHIIPDALGCPKGFIFKNGTVCQSCNNKMGHLDQAVINDFDIISFEAGIRRKGGKLPAVTSRGNLTAGFGAVEKFLVINMDKNSVKDPLNRTVVPYKGGERHIKANISVSSGVGTVSFKTKFASSKKFRRGVYKIAFGSLAYFLGREKVLNNSFDAVRDFVIKGKGDRTIFLKAATDRNFKNQVWSPFADQNGHYLVIMRLAIVEIVVDLSPNQSITPMLKKKCSEIYRNKEWTFIPFN